MMAIALGTPAPGVPQLLQVRTLLKTQDSQSSVGSGFLVDDAGHLAAGHDGATWLARGGELLLPAEALTLVGRHNALNVLAALALVTTVARIDRRVMQAGNSIGGAISQDGRVVAAQNYTPGGVKLFDAGKGETIGPAELQKNKGYGPAQAVEVQGAGEPLFAAEVMVDAADARA